MDIYDVIQEEIKEVKLPITSKSEYNLSVNRGDRMREQIITHYLSELEDSGIKAILMMREDVLYLTKTDSKTYLNEFLTRGSTWSKEKATFFFTKLSEMLREMEIWRVAFDISSLEEQNHIYKLLNDQYWVPRDLINIGSSEKPYFLTVFMPFEMSYKG